MFVESMFQQTFSPLLTNFSSCKPVENMANWRISVNLLLNLKHNANCRLMNA